MMRFELNYIYRKTTFQKLSELVVLPDGCAIDVFKNAELIMKLNSVKLRSVKSICKLCAASNQRDLK